MIDLKAFCGGDAFRPYLAQPFSRGENTYATNGRICLRLPRMADVPEQDKPKAEEIFAKAKMDCQYFELEAFKLPTREEEEDCRACEGRGTDHDCPECTCRCGSCGGTGLHQPTIAVGIGNGVFSHKHVLLMQNLPGLRVGETDGTEAMPFRFDGGDGLVMPMRREAEIQLALMTADRG